MRLPHAGFAMADGIEQDKEEEADEFGIIARYFSPLATDTAALELHDDAAVLQPPEEQEIVVTCDALVEGVHFLKGDPPDSIGHKALAVNLSDLAAKGARPYAYLLSLSLPRETSQDWLEAFAKGLRALQEKAGIALVGGDTTASPGPPSFVITALGLVPQGQAVLRLGAKQGDRLYVSGTIGDAYLGLRLLQDPTRAQVWGLSEEDIAFLVGRYRRPEPRNDLALLVRNFAQASIDVSDGLIGDIEKLCRVSHVGARIEVNRVPFSAVVQKALRKEPALLAELITAGDDYGVVVAVPEKSAADFESEANAKAAAFTPIGEVVPADQNVRVLDAEGKPLELTHTGYSHF
jgi:thiamine-monophosphate kinase